MCWASSTENCMTMHITWTLHFAPEPLRYAHIASPKKSHIKKPLQLPKCCVISQAFIGIIAMYETWTHLLFQDLAKLWSFSEAIWESQFSMARGTNQQLEDAQSLPLSRQSTSKCRGLLAFKTNLCCHFATLPLGTFSVTDIVSSKAFLKVGEKQEHAETLV